MNPLTLFLFSFLAVAFALILIQKDLTGWQKFSLILNPALLALCVLVLIAKSQSDTAYAADLAPVVNVSAELLDQPGTPVAGKAAERIRQFLQNKENDNWKELAADLQKIAEEAKKTEKSTK